MALQRRAKHARTLSTFGVGTSREAAGCRVDARDCLRVLTGDRRRNHSLPLASLSLCPSPAPTLKVLKIFCQAHSFDNNPAESRSSPKVQAAPGVAGGAAAPLLTLPANWTDKRNLFSLFNNLLASRSLPALLICADHVSHLRERAPVEKLQGWIFFTRSVGDFGGTLCLSGAFPNVTLTPCDVI